MSELTPAADLAATNKIRHPGESQEYRAARQALLVEEIELRRHKEKVASCGANSRPAAWSRPTTSSSPRTAPR